MDQNDRLAFEVAMARLRDTREDCLRSLDEPAPAANPRRPAPWWYFGQPVGSADQPLAS
jgi:hypothetical protein